MCTLDGGSGDVKGPIAEVLASLARESGSRDAVAEVPGCLRGLVALLKGQSVDLQLQILGAFWGLAESDIARQEMLQLPDLLPTLVELMGEANPLLVKEAAAGALQSIGQDPETLRVLVSTPGSRGLQTALMLSPITRGRLSVEAASWRRPA